MEKSIDHHGDRLIQFQDQLQFLLADRTQDNTHRIASLNTHLVSIEASIISLREQKNAILQIENDVLPNESEIMRNILIHPT
jgi:hypothetical protein